MAAPETGVMYIRCTSTKCRILIPSIGAETSDHGQRPSAMYMRMYIPGRNLRPLKSTGRPRDMSAWRSPDRVHLREVYMENIDVFGVVSVPTLADANKAVSG